MTDDDIIAFLDWLLNDYRHPGEAEIEGDTGDHKVFLVYDQWGDGDVRSVGVETYPTIAETYCTGRKGTT